LVFFAMLSFLKLRGAHNASLEVSKFAHYWFSLQAFFFPKESKRFFVLLSF